MMTQVNSRTFSPLQIRGLLKAGDIYIPGHGEFPRFSDTFYIHEIDRIADYMTPADREGIQILTTVFGVLPKPLVCLILHWADKASHSKAPWAPVFRQIHIGVKGIIMSLYYSDVSNDGLVFKNIGWNVRCGDVLPTTVAKTAFDRVRSAQGFLRSLTPAERLAPLKRLKQVILEEQERIVDEVQKATGKARTDVLVSEIFGVLDHLAFLEKSSVKFLKDRKAHTPIVLMGKSSRVFFEPLGTVLAISPWNYPFYQAMVPITSALICGNTVVYKPSEVTPLTGLVESLLKKAGVPENWVQVVYGDGKLGEELIEQHPNKIFFTGSTRTGKRIMELASKQLIPVELELGGKDPMIVFEDVDLDRAVAGAAWGALTNSGQSCTSVERLYVHEKIYEEFKTRLKAAFEKLRIDPDKDGFVDLGPMTSDMQVGIVAAHINEAEKAGAKLLTGSKWDRKSRLIPPILLDQCSRDMKVAYDETFGPVLPIISFRSEEEVIGLANHSEYGLSASVWSADLKRATRVARRLITGNVSINNVMVTEGNHSLPFGGTRNSGFGRYKGEFGLYSFSNLKAVMNEKSSRKIEANWFPYTAEKYRLFSDLIHAVFSGTCAWTRFKGFVGFAITGIKLETYVAKVTKSKQS